MDCTAPLKILTVEKQLGGGNAWCRKAGGRELGCKGWELTPGEMKMLGPCSESFHLLLSAMVSGVFVEEGHQNACLWQMFISL